LVLTLLNGVGVLRDEAVDFAHVTTALVAEDAGDDGVIHLGHAAFDVMPEGAIDFVGGEMPEGVSEEENDASWADLGADDVVFEHEVPAGAGAVRLPEGGDALAGEGREFFGVDPGFDHGVAEEDDFGLFADEFVERGAGEEGFAAGEPVLFDAFGFAFFIGWRRRGGFTPESGRQQHASSVKGEVFEVSAASGVHVREVNRDR
jgi:hypothetical protein